MRLHFHFPRPVIPKARPRAKPCRQCGAKPTIVSQANYRDWKEGEAWSLAVQKAGTGNRKDFPLEGYLAARLNVTKDGADVELVPVIGSDHNGRKSVPGDIDNIAGAILDALQDATIYKNDRQIVRLEVTIT